ncbi:MAG: hypothetical protein WDZ59_09605 [Pirellulales bacterium]
MDKKAKKKIDVLQQRVRKLRTQLSGEQSQMDDPEEVERLKSQIAEAEAEIAKWKAQ